MLSLDPQAGPAEGRPWQLEKLQAALGFTCPKYAAMKIREVASLLAGMCHPEAALRMTAAQVAAVGWLRQAAALPLPDCPVAL